MKKVTPEIIEEIISSPLFKNRVFELMNTTMKALEWYTPPSTQPKLEIPSKLEIPCLHDGLNDIYKPNVSGISCPCLKCSPRC